VITGALAGHHAGLWWVDPVGGIAISVVIILRWFALVHEQIKKITGVALLSTSQSSRRR
jgi:divalent metal cation (Fe/Co/Zn/Cd) transporter